MNYLLNSIIAKIPTPIRWAIGIALIAIVLFFLWYKGTQLWNGIGNYFFHRQINSERAKVQKELDDAAAQKQELEKTLVEFAKAKEALAAASREREIREEIFNDKTTTAKEKLQIYQDVMSAAPVHTDPTGVTVSDLCERAKAIGSSAATIAALCGE